MYDTRITSGEAGWTEFGFESPFAEAFDGVADSFGGPAESHDVSAAGEGIGEESGEVEESEAFAGENLDFEVGHTVDGEGFPSGLTLSAATGATGERAEHWDPHSTGLPLLDTGPAVRSQKLSSSFTVGELVRSHGRYADVARISPALVRLLQAIRDRAGRSVQITSGYRSWARNKQVYAGYGKTATLSRHCSGQAADIHIAGMSGLDIAKLALDVGGPNLGIGVGGTYAHVDVRETWAYWTYLSGDAGKSAKAAIARHRAQLRQALQGSPSRAVPALPVLSAPVASVPISPPASPLPPVRQGETKAGGLADRLPLLRSHSGTQPDVVLGWNAMSHPAAIDVVVHLHGFSANRGAMNLRTEMVPISGLDLSGVSGAGRSRPTLTVLPRGNYYGGTSGRGYSFPALVGPGALNQLVAEALARFTARTGVRAPMGRLVLTAHSGGGAALTTILAHTDPDEVYIYDGLYGPAPSVIAWALRRIAGEVAVPSAISPALRVFYRAGSAKNPGTQPNSQAVGTALCGALSSATVTPQLRNRFRVEMTSIDHGDIPGSYGRLLLADADADVPRTTLFTCRSGGARAGESEEFGEVGALGGEGFNVELFEPETPETEHHEAQQYERDQYVVESFDTQGLSNDGGAQNGYGEIETAESSGEHEASQYESEGYESGGYEAGGYEAGGYEAGGYESGGYESGGYESGENVAPETLEWETEDPPPVRNVCGFVTPAFPVVTEADVRRRVVAAARAEQAVWMNSAGALVGESGTSMFGHLVRYWLAEQAPIPAANLVVIADRALRTTYGPSLLGGAGVADATIDAEAGRVARLLIKSLPEPGAPPNLENLVRDAIRAAHFSKVDDIAWSGAFVNSCVRQAGMDLNLHGIAGGGEELLLKLSAFGRHWEYLLEAHRRRLGCRTPAKTFDVRCRQDGTYQAFRTTEHNPQAGDIIVQDRQAKTQSALLTFDRIPALAGVKGRPGGLIMHADIVVDVQPRYAETIGGNVSNTVRRRRYPLDASAALVVSEGQHYIQQATNGSFRAIPAAVAHPPAVLDSSSTARIVSLLRPVEVCRPVHH